MASEEWNEFSDRLLFNTLKEYKKSKECEYLAQKKTQIDEMLSVKLTQDEKQFVGGILFERLVTTDRETEVVYHQGLHDCIWLLKNLGILA